MVLSTFKLIDCGVKLELMIYFFEKKRINVLHYQKLPYICPRER